MTKGCHSHRRIAAHDRRSRTELLIKRSISADLARLSRGEFGVLALSCLFRHAQHRADLGPRPIGATCRSNRFDEGSIELSASFSEVRNCPKRLRVSDDEVFCSDLVGPLLQRFRSCRSRSDHLVHHPFRNFGRAGIAWITATPSSSSTTPTSNGSPIVDGPMSIVTAEWSVSNARQ